jgi:hypothetical protein
LRALAPQLMSWAVRLQNERGKPVINEDAGIDFELVDAVVGHKLLRYIEPYGDTVFNQQQMDYFIDGWKLIQPKAAEQKQPWEKVFRMATKCKNEEHLYLKFIGD